MQKQTADRSEMLRIQEFAERMGISVWTARSWVRERRVSSCKPAGHIYVPASEIDRLLAENMRPHLAHCGYSAHQSAAEAA